MKWTFDEHPKKDGRYIFALHYNDGEWSHYGSVSYTTAAGWNTYYDLAGNLNESPKFGFEIIKGYCDGFAWAELAEFTDMMDKEKKRALEATKDDKGHKTKTKVIIPERA